MSLLCRIGWHDWIYEGKESYTLPLRGPFDQRSEKVRTFEREMKICSQCGKRTEYHYDPY